VKSRDRDHRALFEILCALEEIGLEVPSHCTFRKEIPCLAERSPRDSSELRKLTVFETVKALCQIATYRANRIPNLRSEPELTGCGTRRSHLEDEGPQLVSQLPCNQLAMISNRHCQLMRARPVPTRISRYFGADRV
jgi:hypothetical protein